MNPSCSRASAPVLTDDLMNKHDLDRLPVVESQEDRRLIGVVRSEKILRWLVEQS
ncbi:MAG: CBS domain-containing protein [Nitrospira sp.]